MRKEFFFALLACLLVCTSGVAKKKEKRSVVRIETSMGNIRVALSDDTPIHRDNFLKLASKGFYEGTLFHRVIRDFMIQGGDPDSKGAAPGAQLGDGGPGYTLEPEFLLPYLYHWRGVIAAARESDDVNPEMRSSSTQFYIVYGRSFGETSLGKVRGALEENGIEMNYEMWQTYLTRGGAPHLDGTYTVFGHVIDGMKVVKAIQATPTDSLDRPLKDVVLLRAVVE